MKPVLAILILAIAADTGFAGNENSRNSRTTSCPLVIEKILGTVDPTLDPSFRETVDETVSAIFSDSPSRSAVSYNSRDALVGNVNRRLRETADHSYGGRNFAAAFDGREADEVVIITHPINEFPQETLLVLDGLPDAPRLFLASEAFPINNKALQDAASAVRYSALGELSDVVLNTGRVHLMGGACQICLARTTSNLVEKFLSINPRTTGLGRNGELYIVLHQSAVYPRPSNFEYLRNLVIDQLTDFRKLSHVAEESTERVLIFESLSGKRVIYEIAEQ